MDAFKKRTLFFVANCVRGGGKNTTACTARKLKIASSRNKQKKQQHIEKLLCCGVGATTLTTYPTHFSGDMKKRGESDALKKGAKRGFAMCGPRVSMHFSLSQLKISILLLS